jgi:hypothetical protein
VAKYRLVYFSGKKSVKTVVTEMDGCQELEDLFWKIYRIKNNHNLFIF